MYFWLTFPIYISDACSFKEMAMAIVSIASEVQSASQSLVPQI